MQAFNVGYPSLNDPGDQIALAFHSTVPPAAIPTTLVIDRERAGSRRAIFGACQLRRACRRSISKVIGQRA